MTDLELQKKYTASLIRYKNGEASEKENRFWNDFYNSPEEDWDELEELNPMAFNVFCVERFLGFERFLKVSII